MNSFVIAAVVVTLILLVGAGLAGLVAAFSGQVNRVRIAVSQPKTINPQISLGHPLTLNAAPAEMMAEAEILAAKRAAHQPRGANMRIGRLGAENLLTARNEVKDDPITAVKIARYHGWDLFKTENPWLQPAAPEPTAVAVAAPAARSAADLVPGKDYPFTEITDSMSPEEVRKARVANAKAKSAAVKALKESGETAAPAAATTTAAAPAAAAAAPKLDYQEIPITDNMSPEEIRKARIANAKAKSAAAKAAKEAGVAVAPAPAAAPAPAPAPAVAPPPAAIAEIPANIPAPDYVEISDDMDPAAVRKARIANAKTKSAYNKALKEAGIDPATVA